MTASAREAPRVESYPESYYREPAPSWLRAYKMQLARNARPAPEPRAPLSGVACVAGMAGEYPCSNVDLESFVPLSELEAEWASGLWGWTDPESGREYALLAVGRGTAIIDIGNPRAPIFVGFLPTHTKFAYWRDVRVYGDHAFIISEADGHGMQIFDLTQLRSVTSPPVILGETAHYAAFGSAHTIAIDEASGFAYAAGSDTCAGGLHIVDVRVPTAPSFAGCVADDGYTHETQCLPYHGPDTAYRGREICFNCNEDTLTIVDVSDKSLPRQLSRTSYEGIAYTHQASVSEDHRYLLLDDELDEPATGVRTTFIWDVSDLDAPFVLGTHVVPVIATDHNQYIRGSFTYQANYKSGFSVLDLCCLPEAELSEVAFFDVHPEDDSYEMLGAWLAYPFFESGVVIVSSVERGLFVLRPHLPNYADGSGSCPGLPWGWLPDVANALRAVKRGADALLSVAAEPSEGGGYNVHRSEAKALAGPLVAPAPTTRGSSFADLVLGDGRSYFYAMRGVTSCGFEGP